MKKIIILLVVFLGSFFIFSSIHVPQRLPHPTKKQEVPTTTVIPTMKAKSVGIPQTIIIPAIGINAPVEQTGLDAQGRMGVPQTATDTAWYKYGYKPGEHGSAVIDGHFDTVTGAPAVFYNVGKLQPGDSITIVDSFNHSYIFHVSEVISYPFDQLPMQQIFASTDTASLNLITCSGTWDKNSHNYSNRAVVYSVLTANQ